jgi:putative transposase
VLPTRETARLEGFDYGQPGTYFTTVCSFNKQMLFGSVRSGVFHPASLGYLIQERWPDIPKHHGNVGVGTFQCMPNHIHGIIVIKPPKPTDDKPPATSLGTIVGGYKSAVSREAGKLGISGGRIWGSRFYDHIVRHEGALRRIEEYIVNNPLQWSLDRENPDRTGESEFYEWLEKYGQHLKM